MSAIDRVRKCGRVTKGLSVELAVGSDGGAAFHGLTTCGSVWACPACALKVMAKRSEELAGALGIWADRGGSVAMVTLTMRHHAGQDIEDLWPSLSDAWGAAWQTRAAKHQKRAAGVAGWVRVVEATHGANGWHLHVHALVLLEDAERADDLGDALFTGWRARLVKRGLDAPIAGSGGLDVKLLSRAGAAGAVSEYLAKATLPERAAAVELAGQATKRGRKGNRTPFGILADIAEAHENGGYGTAAYRRDRALWRAWEKASHGRRAMTWSVGVRDLLGLAAEQSDDDLVADDDRAVPVGRISHRDWADLCWRPDLPDLLEVVERCAPELRYDVASWWLRERGYGFAPPLRVVDPPDPPGESAERLQLRLTGCSASAVAL